MLFTGTVFSGGEVSFHRAAFSGGEVGFDRARFSGGTVSFAEARNWADPPTFSWDGKPPRV